MARPEGTSYRQQWWEDRLKAAQTPKAKVTVLQGKILADIAKLPEHQQDPARSLVAVLLENVLDEIQIKVAEEAWA